MKSTWSMILVAAAIVLFLVVLSGTGKKPPLIPSDQAHAGLIRNEDCTPCHAPGKQSPLKENHPPKEQCVICHKAGKG